MAYSRLVIYCTRFVDKQARQYKSLRTIRARILKGVVYRRDVLGHPFLFHALGSAKSCRSTCLYIAFYSAFVID